MHSLSLNLLRDKAGAQDRLLPFNQKRLAAHSVAGVSDLLLDGESSNRRTVGLLPMPSNRQDHELAETDSVRLQQLLLSIEARKLSCCIRVFSNGRKSRSALLVYRGRLIGCVFGRRDLPDQVYGKAGFEYTMADLVSPGNIIDAYVLSEELVLATASLFHSGLNEVFDGAHPVKVFPSCAQMMIKNKRTGCIVVNAGEESALCVTYICEGRIVGVYSFASGWLTKTQAAAIGCFEYTADAEILMSILPVECDMAESLTESLSGLDFVAPAELSEDRARPAS